MVAGLWFIRW